jgi:hypothetical protein
MKWHGLECEVLARAPFRRGVKRNCLIILRDGQRKVVPWRALRK